MHETSSERTTAVGTRLPTDWRTVACVALGGALAAVATAELSDATAWRELAFDIRIVGLFALSLLAGALFAARAAVGERWFAFLIFGVLAGFSSVGVYCLVSLLSMPPAAGLRFLVAAPIAAALGIAAGGALGRRLHP